MATRSAGKPAEQRALVANEAARIMAEGGVRDFGLAKRIDVSPVPGIIGIAIASNLQGTATLIGDPPEMGSYVLPGNNYHVYDIPLFWANTKADVARRVNALTGATSGS